MAQPGLDLQLPPKPDRIAWIDYEMTGLEPERHIIARIMALITDVSLNVLGEGVDIIVHVSGTGLVRVDDFAAKMRTKSGLDQKIRTSKTNAADAEQTVLDYTRQWVPESRTVPLTGNLTVSDRKFIHRYVLELDQYLYYRMVNVSSFEELARRQYPQVLKGALEKGLARRAPVDAKGLIHELDCYCHTMPLSHPSPRGDTISATSKESTEKYGEIRDQPAL